MPTFTKTFINPVVTLKEFPFNGKTRTTPEQGKLWFNYQRKNYDWRICAQTLNPVGMGLSKNPSSDAKLSLIPSESLLRITSPPSLISVVM